MAEHNPVGDASPKGLERPSPTGFSFLFWRVEMNEKVLGALVRHVLTIAAGALVSKGILESSTVEPLVGGLMAVIGVGWSVFQKVKA